MKLRGCIATVTLSLWVLLGFMVAPIPSPASTPATPAASVGHITYRLGDRLYRLAVQEGATPEDVSAALDALSAGTDG